MKLDVSYDTDVIVELLLTLSCLAVRNEFCQEIVDEGGLQYVMAAVLGDLQEQVSPSTFYTPHF